MQNPHHKNRLKLKALTEDPLKSHNKKQEIERDLVEDPREQIKNEKG